MKTGLAAMQEAVERGKAKAASVGTGGGGSLRIMKWEVGEKKIIRFVHKGEHLITADFYQSIMCADGKPRSFLIDPRREDIVAKYRNGVIGMTRKYGTGNLVEPEKREQSLGIAVEREDRTINVAGGPPQTEIVDKQYIEERDGQRLPARIFGLVQQSESNFWTHISGIVNRYGDLCCYDLEITRTGNADYAIHPLLAFPGGPVIDEKLRDPAVVEQVYGYGREWKNDDPERFLYCPRTLANWVDYFGSEEYQRQWLVPKENQPAYPAPGPVVPAATASYPGFAPGAGGAQVPVSPVTPASGFGGSGYGEFHGATTHNPGPGGGAGTGAAPASGPPWPASPESWRTPSAASDEAKAVPPQGTEYATLLDRVQRHRPGVTGFAADTPPAAPEGTQQQG